MADYNWDMENYAGGFTGLVSTPDMSNNNAHQDESEEKNGDRPGEASPSSQELPKGHGDTDTGVVGPNSGRGTSSKATGTDDRPSSFCESQFGLEAKTISYGQGNSSSRDTDSYADFDGFCVSRPLSSTEQNTASTHGAKKHGLINKIKEKLPGHHHTAGRTIEIDSPESA